MDPTPAPVVLVDWAPGFAEMAQSLEDAMMLGIFAVVALGFVVCVLLTAQLIASVVSR